MRLNLFVVLLWILYPSQPLPRIPPKSSPWKTRGTRPSSKTTLGIDAERLGEFLGRAADLAARIARPAGFAICAPGAVTTRHTRVSAIRCIAPITIAICCGVGLISA